MTAFFKFIPIMSETVRIKVKLNFRSLPLLLVLFFLLELIWAERVWMMLFVGLGIIWLLDLLWARSLVRGLRFQRELRYDWAHVGDQLEERLTLTNTGWAPALWLELRDASTLPDYQASVATGVGAHSENSWRNKHICTRRGIFSLGPTQLHSATLFGIYAVELEYQGRLELIVMPPVVPLPEIEVAPGGHAQEGRRRASTLERTVSANGIREYLPGDPYKLIHWRTAAHYDELMVRTFESTPAGDWWVWLDLDASAQASTGENSTIEHAVILAASLATRGLTGGRAVGLVANAREMVWMPPQAHEAQRLQILRALATVEPGTRTLAELLAQTRAALHRNSSVILITANVRGDWLDEVLSLRLRGASPTVVLLDPATFGGTGSPNEVTALLAEWNISCFVITADMLGSSESKLARQGYWEWSVGATGRAIPRVSPQEPEWRPLA